MPNRCIVFGCSNEPNLKEGVALHAIPFANDDRPEAKKRKKRWVDFVQKKMRKWTPGSTSSICSDHFTEDDFVRKFSLLPDQKKPVIPRLKRDEFGVSVWPTAMKSEEVIMSKRYIHRMVRI